MNRQTLEIHKSSLAQWFLQKGQKKVETSEILPFMSADDVGLWSFDGPKHTQAADQDILHSRTPIKQNQMKNKHSSRIFTHTPIQMLLYSQTCEGNIKSMILFPPLGTQALTNSE